MYISFEESFNPKHNDNEDLINEEIEPNLVENNAAAL
jgi:hypothetical protein